jgi:drug/metabolite transporter superfamily protein YnfA
MTRERLTFGHGAHVPVPRVAAATAATTAHEATPVHFSRPETWDWAWGGLLVFTVLLFFRPQDQIPFLRDSHLANVAALVGLAAMVGLNLSRRLPITRLTPELVALALFGLVIGITIPLSFWPGGAFTAFETLYIPVLLIFVLMVNTMTSPRRVERIVWIIVVAVG